MTSLTVPVGRGWTPPVAPTAAWWHAAAAISAVLVREIADGIEGTRGAGHRTDHADRGDAGAGAGGGAAVTTPFGAIRFGGTGVRGAVLVRRRGPVALAEAVGPLPDDASGDRDDAGDVDGEAAAVDRDELLNTLFREEAVALVRLARLFTDDRNAAEDLVQEAFVRLHHAAHRIREPDRAAAYLRSIVLNLARDHNRRGLMSLRHFEALTPEASPVAPEDRIQLDEQQTRIIDALRDLSPQQRDCLVLRFYLELSERETAETLGISPNSVKTHCRRGFDRLRLMLGDEG